MVKSGVGVVRTRLEGEDPRYWQIGQYGVIGDCRTAALVAPNGSIDWLCLPHFDSQAILCRLLDADRGGYFQARPADACESSMRYLPATNLLETTFVTESGQVSMLDFMPIRNRQPHESLWEAVANLTPLTAHHERAHLERDIGNDVSAAHRIDRIITCDSGEVTLSITLKLTPKYATETANIDLRVQQDDALSAILSIDDQYYVAVAKVISGLHGADESQTFGIDQQESEFKAHVLLKAGQRIALALNFARNEREADELLGRLLTRDFDDDVAESLEYWHGWSDKFAYHGPYADMVLRSALALKLCVFEPTGAIVAAPTSSLPEGIGGERNWDYRFTWLRDSSFTLQALGVLGYHGEARDYFHFLHDLHLSNGADFRVMYTIRGESEGALAEQSLHQLEGYMGSQPVRIGNGAATQRQMDIYGELADAALLYAQALGYCAGPRARESPRDLLRLVTVIADFVMDHWQDLDRGIWEVRGPERAFVYSRVMCWVALDRAMQMAAGHEGSKRHAHWQSVADQLRSQIEQQGYSEELKSFTQAYGVDAVDAANFRMLLVNYLPPTDERLRNTVATTGHILNGDSALIYRYRSAEHPSRKGEEPATDDGLKGSEGAFLACAFWYVSNLALMGELDEARKRFERLLEYASPLGLFSEEVDPKSGALLGNYPQAFTHIGLINAAHQLAMAEERAQQRCE